VTIADSTQTALVELQTDTLFLIDAVVTTMRRREGTGSNPNAGLDLVQQMRGQGYSAPAVIYSTDVTDQQRSIALTLPSVQVLSSFIDVVNALGGRCASCGKVLVGEEYYRLDDRIPCPNCGATIRHFLRPPAGPTFDQTPWMQRRG